MTRNDMLIGEIQQIPRLTAFHAISPYLELRQHETNQPIWGLVELNVATGEALFARKDAAGQIMKDHTGQALTEKIVLDLKNFYLAFKPQQ